MNHRQKYCVKHGHDWAFDTKNRYGWMLGICTICNTRQWMFVPEVKYEPDLDDDSTKKQNMQKRTATLDEFI